MAVASRIRASERRNTENEKPRRGERRGWSDARTFKVSEVAKFKAKTRAECECGGMELGR